jgi:hypothetical protein
MTGCFAFRPVASARCGAHPSFEQCDSSFHHFTCGSGRVIRPDHGMLEKSCAVMLHLGISKSSI